MFLSIHLNLPIESANKNTQSSFLNSAGFCLRFSSLKNGRKNGIITDGQKEEDYQSYTMKIGCNAAGDAKFETNYLGLTNVTIGKWLGTDCELVSFENYNWKVHFLSVTGKVIYTQ